MSVLLASHVRPIPSVTLSAVKPVTGEGGGLDAVADTDELAFPVVSTAATLIVTVPAGAPKMLTLCSKVRLNSSLDVMRVLVVPGNREDDTVTAKCLKSSSGPPPDDVVGLVHWATKESPVDWTVRPVTGDGGSASAIVSRVNVLDHCEVEPSVPTALNCNMYRDEGCRSLIRILVIVLYQWVVLCPFPSRPTWLPAKVGLALPTGHPPTKALRGQWSPRISFRFLRTWQLLIQVSR